VSLWKDLWPCDNDTASLDDYAAADRPDLVIVGQSYSAFTATLAAMITPATVAVVLGGAPSCLVDGVYRVLLAWILHLPPSAVPLVSDVRFPPHLNSQNAPADFSHRGL
jgi:hypothetical protein